MKKKIIIISAIAFGAVLIIAILAMKISGTRQSGLYSSSIPIPVERFGGGAKSEMSLGKQLSPSEAIPTSSIDQEDSIPTEKKIIKNGDLNLKVSKVDDAVEEIGKIAKENGGDVFSSNLYQTAKNVKSGTVTVKVPVNNFEKAFSKIKEAASLVVRESISGNDVTEQYIDLQSRLKNKQSEEQSFVAILGRAGTVEDILKVTRELSRVRGEIEVLQGRIKLLNSQTDMATITATLSEDAEITITDSWRPLRLMKDTVNSLLGDIQGFVNFAIVLVIRVIPVLFLYLLLVFVIFLFGRKIYRKIRRKKEENEGNAS